MPETLGNKIDQLTIVNIRIWNAEDIKRKKGASDNEIADATRVTNAANQQRNDLIQEIDEGLNKLANGIAQKLYNQGDTKMYGKQ